VTETDRIKARLLELPPSERLFRINAGLGWQGDKIERSGNVMIILNPRPLQAGPTGWPDCVGWRTVEITQDMVGQRVAVFLAEEHKRDARDKLRKEQRRLRGLMERMGAIYRVITG